MSEFGDHCNQSLSKIVFTHQVELIGDIKSTRSPPQSKELSYISLSEGISIIWHSKHLTLRLYPRKFVFNQVKTLCLIKRYQYIITYVFGYGALKGDPFLLGHQVVASVITFTQTGFPLRNNTVIPYFIVIYFIELHRY